jgi:hypothetical protein
MYAAIAAIGVVVSEVHTVTYALIVASLAWHRWDWGGLISPSAYLCWAVLLWSVFGPLMFAGVGWSSLRARSWLRSGDDPAELGPSYLAGALFCLAMIFAVPYIADFLIWGTFPFTFDQAGAGYLRVIPFFPWPSRALGTL